MHDRVEVVCAYVISVGDMLKEVMFAPRNDIFEYYPYVPIPIFSTLFMPQPHSVADFVDRSAKSTARPYRDYLPPALHPNKRPTAVSLFEHNEIREGVSIARVSLHETERGPLLPMVHRVQDELPGRVIDLEGNGASWPAKPGTSDYNTTGRQITERPYPSSLAYILLYIFDVPYDDVSFEDGLPPDNRVCYGLVFKRVARNNSLPHII
jgi:hypothetical protein